MPEALPVGHLNGRYAALDTLNVSVLDRGFLFGDAVYEVIPVYAGVPFRSDAHLARLRRSLAQIRMPDPLARGAWESLLEGLVARNGGGNMALYVQITRGAENGRDHRIKPDARPTVFAMAMMLPPRPPDLASAGVAAVTREDIRWARCDIKSTSLLANLLLASEAREAGAAEAILLRDGHVTEGASSSVFVVRDGTVHLPPYAPALLPGTTRDFVVELLAAAGREVREQVIPRAMLFAAEEIWIASATREVLPVSRLDGRTVGGGVPGPGWQAVDRLFQEHKRIGAR